MHGKPVLGGVVGRHVNEDHFLSVWVIKEGDDGTCFLPKIKTIRNI